MKKYLSFITENTDQSFLTDYTKLSKIISDFEHSFLTGYGEEFSNIMKRTDEEVKKLDNEWLSKNKKLPGEKEIKKTKVVKTENGDYRSNSGILYTFKEINNNPDKYIIVEPKKAQTT